MLLACALDDIDSVDFLLHETNCNVNETTQVLLIVSSLNLLTSRA